MSYVAGRVGLVPKGEWNATTQYEKLDIVSYNGKGYIASARNIPVGTLPTNSTYFMESFDISELAPKQDPKFKGSISSNTESEIHVEINTALLRTAETFTLTNLGDLHSWRVKFTGTTWKYNKPISIYGFVPMIKIIAKNEYYEITFQVYQPEIDDCDWENGEISFSVHEENWIDGFDYISVKFNGQPYEEKLLNRSITFERGRADYPNITSNTQFTLTVIDETDVGTKSVALGDKCSAGGSCSQSFGRKTISSSDEQMVIGKYNIEDTEGKYAFIIGNGTDDANRSNALAIKWNGEIVTSNF